MRMLTRMCRASLALLGVLMLCFVFGPGSAVSTAADAIHAEANPADHGAATPGGHGGDHPTGPPIAWERDLVLWTIVVFVVFLLVLKFAAWGPLVEGLNTREAKYQKLLDDAVSDRANAIKMLADYDHKLKAAQSKVDEIIAEARRDAETTKQDIVATAQREAKANLDRAKEEIGRAKDQAMVELFSHMRANVVSATERVLARAMNDADHQRLIDEALAEVSTR